MDEIAGLDRAAIERQFGLRSGVLRLGILGAPRQEKRVDLATEAVAASKRDDVELLVFSGNGAESLWRASFDPRVVVLPHERAGSDEYNRRLAMVDVVLMPFDDGEMLTTGAVGDAVGLGPPSLVSGWPYLAEILGDESQMHRSSATAVTGPQALLSLRSDAEEPRLQ